MNFFCRQAKKMGFLSIVLCSVITMAMEDKYQMLKSNKELSKVKSQKEWEESARKKLSKQVYSEDYIRALTNNLDRDEQAVFALRLGEHKDSVFHYSIRQNYDSIVEFMLEYIVKNEAAYVLQMENGDQQTALELARQCYSHDIEMIELIEVAGGMFNNKRVNKNSDNVINSISQHMESSKLGLDDSLLLEEDDLDIIQNNLEKLANSEIGVSYDEESDEESELEIREEDSISVLDDQQSDSSILSDGPVNSEQAIETVEVIDEIIKEKKQENRVEQVLNENRLNWKNITALATSTLAIGILATIVIKYTNKPKAQVER